jgi:glucokinase
MTVLGIDIGGTRIKAGLVEESGTVVTRAEVSTPHEFSAFAERLKALASEVAGRGHPGAAGIGCRGIIDPSTTEVVTLPGSMKFLEGHRLADLAGLDIPVAADNDARAALAGEFQWGAARGRRDVVMLTLGTGVGGGVISGGRVLRGARGVAGHLGHMTIDPDGPVCICGNHGCVETLFSARAIEAEALSAVHRGCITTLSDGPRDCKAVFEAAAAGDEVARVIRDRAIKVLGAALAGLVHIFDPEVVILGGQIADAGPALFEPLQAEVRWRTACLLSSEVPIVSPLMGEDAAIAGAAALASLVAG